MSNQEAIHLVTGIGRLVRGSLTERATHDYDNNPYEAGKGPFEIGFAIEKTESTVNDLLGKLYGQAVAGYPGNAQIKQRIDNEYSSGFSMGQFRFKIRDGDKPNQEGKTNPNTKNCWVLNLSTHLPFKVTYTDQYGLKLTDPMGQTIPPRTEIDPKLAKIGDYGHFSISTRVNGKLDGTAGLYLNPNAFMLAGYGEAITGGVSLDEAFAAVPTGQLPGGASVQGAAPAGMATTNPLPGAAPAMPAATAPVPGGAPTLPTASPTSAPVQPHTQFLQAAPVGLPLPGQ